MKNISKMVSLVVLVLLSLLHRSLVTNAHELDILTFKASNDSGIPISYAKLDERTPKLKLPNKFTFCISHLESYLMGNSFVTILGEDGKPWLSLSFWFMDGVPQLLVQQRGSIWLKIKELKNFKIIFWLHTCLNVDVETNELTFALKGEPLITLKANNLTENKPKFITGNLVLALSDQGKSDDPKQFVGSVANLHLEEDVGSNNLEKMVHNLCESSKGIIDDGQHTWTFMGNVMKEKGNPSEICREGPVYTLGIDTPMKFMPSMELCKKLGFSSITQVDSEEELLKIVKMLKDGTYYCKYIWTPLSDKQEEGVFRGLFTGEVPKYFPWKTGTPDGGREQNNIIIDTRYNLYDDKSESHVACTTCDVPIHTSFTLRGACKDTYMSKISVEDTVH